MVGPTTNVLRELAEAHRLATLRRLPANRLERFVLFVEVVRVVDYWGIHARASGDGRRWPQHQIDLMYWGWNMAVAELLEPLDQPGAFPIMESSRQTREIAVGLLQEFGKVSLLRRLADMGEHGIVDIVRDGDDFDVRMTSDARAQFADAMEIDRLESAEERLQSGSTGWAVASMRDAVRFPDMPGAYIAKADLPVRRWLRSDVDELIKPLVRPWETGHGVMVAYDARIEVDKHFMAEALGLAADWRQSAGIHPDARLRSITGADIAGVAAALASLHSKHVRCVLVASKLFGTVSVPQSLTIWGPRSELEESISVMSGQPAEVVRAAFDVVALTSEQAKKMVDHTTPLIPLLFDLGNSFVLRPVASLTRNPFTAVKTQHQWLDSRTEHAIAADREAWMRSELYGLFGGRRYSCFPGNLKLRRAASLLTDIDAVVYDRLTGEVGLFQLKWQDYSMNDVRQLRSKASNLASELEEWAAKVKDWLAEQGASSLAQSLRLKQKRGETVKKVFLFGISRAVVRTQGYGVRTVAPDLAMGVWAQFVRARIEAGPAAHVLRDIHSQLLGEHGQLPTVEPMPASISVAGMTLHVHDLWNRTE